MGNVGDNGVSSYLLHLKHNSYRADATPICYLREVEGGSRQPLTGRLATLPDNTAVNHWEGNRGSCWSCVADFSGLTIYRLKPLN